MAAGVQKEDVTIYANPLDSWKNNFIDLPLLPELAHHPGNIGAVGTDVIKRGTDSHEDSKQAGSN